MSWELLEWSGKANKLVRWLQTGTKDQIQHAIDRSKQNNQYVHTINSAFLLFSFVLLFFPLELFA